jgi:hypothetical protein
VATLGIFHNLASQLDGDWALMRSQKAGQEWILRDGSLRLWLMLQAQLTAIARYKVNV